MKINEIINQPQLNEFKTPPKSGSGGDDNRDAWEKFGDTLINVVKEKFPEVDAFWSGLGSLRPGAAEDATPDVYISYENENSKRVWWDEEEDTQHYPSFDINISAGSFDKYTDNFQILVDTFVSPQRAPYVNNQEPTDNKEEKYYRDVIAGYEHPVMNEILARVGQFYRLCQ